MGGVGIAADFQNKTNAERTQLTKILQPYVTWVYIGVTTGMGIILACLILYVPGIIDIPPSAKIIADSWGLSLQEFIKMMDINISLNIFFRLGFMILLIIPFVGYGIIFILFLKHNTKYKAVIIIVFIQIVVFGAAIAVSI